MEITELAKELFKGNKVRIFRTKEIPLFVANDVGKILGIKNTRSAISKFEDYKKSDVDITDPHGRMQQTMVLTEAGLYSLVLKSKKPVAKEFEKWVLTEVLPTIRRTGNYSLQDTIDKQRLQKQLEETQLENDQLKHRTIELSQSYKPTIVYHDYDINEFTNKPCVYLISIGDVANSDFKFGVSGEIDCRSATHFAKFKKLGLDPKIIKLWNCETMKIMRDTELKIKLFAKQNNCLS
jgi:prophage antirepressor-like protein